MKATDVPSEVAERLDLYVTLLTRWNRRIRLTGLDFTAPGRNPVRESLDLIPFLDTPPSNALDIGSGNGLPAIPLSIAAGIPFVLVESDRRKATFLREVAREVACPAIVEVARIEDLAPQPYDLVTARAFARLSTLLALAHPRQAQGAVCLFPKGPDLDDELAEARHAWSFDATLHPAAHGHVVEIRSIAPRSTTPRSTTPRA